MEKIDCDDVGDNNGFFEFNVGSESELKSLLFGRFEPTDKDIVINQLASQYHEECEEYDKTVCSCERYGVAMPADNSEFVLINKNAIRVRSRIINTAGLNGISKDEILQGIRQWSKINP